MRDHPAYSLKNRAMPCPRTMAKMIKSAFALAPFGSARKTSHLTHCSAHQLTAMLTRDTMILMTADSPIPVPSLRSHGKTIGDTLVVKVIGAIGSLAIGSFILFFSSFPTLHWCHAVKDLFPYPFLGSSCHFAVGVHVVNDLLPYRIASLYCAQHKENPGKWLNNMKNQANIYICK